MILKVYDRFRRFVICSNDGMGKAIRQAALFVFIGVIVFRPLYAQEEQPSKPVEAYSTEILKSVAPEKDEYLEVDLISDEDLQKLITIKNFSCPESPGGSCYGIDLVNQIVLFQLLDFKPADADQPADSDDHIYEKLLSVNPFSKERELEFADKLKPMLSIGVLREWNRKYLPKSKVKDRIEAGLGTIIEKQMAKAIADSYKVPQKPITIYGFTSPQDFMVAMDARKEDPINPLKRAVAYMTSHQKRGAGEFFRGLIENMSDNAGAKAGDAQGQAAFLLKTLGEGVPMRLGYSAFIGGHALTAVGYRVRFSADEGPRIQIKVLDSNRPQQFGWLTLKRANVDEPGFGNVRKLKGHNLEWVTVAENVTGDEGKKYEKETENIESMFGKNSYQPTVWEIKAGDYYWIYEPWLGMEIPDQPMLTREARTLEDRPSWLRGLVTLVMPGDDMKQAARQSLRPRIKLPDSVVKLKMEETIQSISKSVEKISDSSANESHCNSK